MGPQAPLGLGQGITGGGVLPSTTMTAAQAIAWLQKLLASYNAAYTAIQSISEQAIKDSTSWNSDASDVGDVAATLSGGDAATLKTGVSDLLTAVEVASVLETAAAKVTDPTTGMASLDIQGTVGAISALLQAGAVNLTVMPTPPAPGTNLASDALGQLNVLADQLDQGNVAAAQLALNALAGDVQAIAGQGSTDATGSVNVGGVSSGSAVAIGAGGLAVGAVAGGMLGHAIASGALFAGESRRRGAEESRKKRRR